MRRFRRSQGRVIRGQLLTLVTAIVLFLALVMIFGPPAHAQALVDPSYAYTVADPVRDGAIGLVTTEGRFAVSRGDDCAASGIGAYQEVLYWRIENFTGLGSIGVVDDQGVMHLCTVRLEQLVDRTPCFEDAEGACDVALEFGG
jgi:hypothetical protein